LSTDVPRGVERLIHVRDGGASPYVVVYKQGPRSCIGHGPTAEEADRKARALFENGGKKRSESV
jgi:hypothetical protein